MTMAWPSGSVRQLLMRAARRWGWAVGGVLTGMGLALGWGADVYEQHGQLQQTVQALREAALPPVAARPAVAADAPAAPALIDHLPAQSDAASLWLTLQEGLSQQGLQVQALRPQALQPGPALSSQAVALRLQGRYADVASAWRSLVDAGPVWTLDRLTVTASGPAGQLQWDGLWRVWMRPGAAGEQAWPSAWNVAAGRSVQPQADPFVSGLGSVAAPVTGASEPVAAPVSADPRQWPLAAIRLMGVWQQDGHPQAVLGAGAHWAVLAPGARLALENYRVQAVHPDAVVLQALKGPGTVQILRLEGSPR